MPDQNQVPERPTTSGPVPASSVQVGYNDPGVKHPRRLLKSLRRRKKPGGSQHGFLTILGIFVSALLVAWCLVTFVFQQYQVDGISMEPTLQNNNRLIVLKIQRTWSRITGHPYIPSRGNIIIFNESNLYGLSSSGSEQLVKRVIGLPGDRVTLKNGYITIYNKQYPNGFDPDKVLPYGKVIGDNTIPENGEQSWTLGKNQVFVCGDNRSNSLDSRDFGPVSASQIIGQLVIRISPLSEIKDF